MQNQVLSKFKSYIGICVALLLGFTFLYPQKSSIIHITPVDNDRISYFVQRSSTAFQLLLRVERFVIRCPNRPASNDTLDCNFYELAPDIVEIIELQNDIMPYFPNIKKELDAYFKNGMKSEDMLGVRESVIAIYPELLGGYKTTYVIATTAAHLAFLVLLIAFFWWRQQVGSFLMLLLFTPFKLLFKGAKAAHRKV